MATKLKNMRLTSVDLVRNGANQEADICLFKSADPTEDPAAPEEIEKDYSTFGSVNAARESNEKLWQYTSALTESIRSIQMDQSLDNSQKIQLMAQSLGQFDTAMSDLFEVLCNTAPTGNDAVMAKSDPGEEDDDFFYEGDDFEEDPDEGVGKSADIDEIEEV